MAAVALAVVLGAGSWTLTRDPARGPGSPSGPSATGAAPATVAETLESLAVALEAGDRDAAVALAPPGDRGAEAWLRAVATSAGRLGLRVELRYVDDVPVPAGATPSVRSVAVDATWRYAGDTGRAPARARLSLDLADTPGGGVAVEGVGTAGTAGAGRVPLWLTGPVVVRRTPGVLVAVAGQGVLVRREAARYTRLVTRAVDVVHRVLPRWPTRVVVEVPATGAALDRALGAEPGHSRAVAAVTAPVDGSTAGRAPVHVFVNPDVFSRLGATGAQVVLSHETVHLAVDAARSAAPVWLVEGFADYVALRDVRLPMATAAGQIIDRVRRDGVPAALPGGDAFDTGPAGAGHLGATYESAWIACRIIARVGGERALVDAYDEVSAGADLSTALERRAGLTEEQLTRRWQRRLAALARAGG